MSKCPKFNCFMLESQKKYCVTEVPPFRLWCYLTPATQVSRSKLKIWFTCFPSGVFDEHKAIDVVVKDFIRCYQCSDMLVNLGALTSWTRLRTEYIRREREGSERDRDRPRTSENQANIHRASVKILVGHSSKHVNHSLNTLVRLAEINITLLSNLIDLWVII